MVRSLSGPLVGGAILVFFVPMVFVRSGAFGLDAAGGGQGFLNERWSVVGSIAPSGEAERKPALPFSVGSDQVQGRLQQKGGVVILMERATAKTFALRLGDLLPGTDLYRISHIGDQKIRVTDGHSDYVISHQDMGNPAPLADEEKFSPLGALEAYYQSLGQTDFDGETYQDFMKRVETEDPELDAFSGEGESFRRRPRRHDELTITSDSVHHEQTPLQRQGYAPVVGQGEEPRSQEGLSEGLGESRSTDLQELLIRLQTDSSETNREDPPLSVTQSVRPENPWGDVSLLSSMEPPVSTMREATGTALAEGAVVVHSKTQGDPRPYQGPFTVDESSSTLEAEVEGERPIPAAAWPPLPGRAGR